MAALYPTGRPNSYTTPWDTISADVAAAMSAIVGRSVEPRVVPYTERLDAYRAWDVTGNAALAMSDPIPRRTRNVRRGFIYREQLGSEISLLLGQWLLLSACRSVYMCRARPLRYRLGAIGHE